MGIRLIFLVVFAVGLAEPQPATATVPTEFDPEDEGAFKFGITPTSHLQYPTLDSSSRKYGLISMDVKTNATSGVLFYVSDSRQIDKSFAYIKDGYVNFGFDYGSGPLVLQSNIQINDGEWHLLEFDRVRATGIIRVDGVQVAIDEITGSSSYLTTSEPFYLGGLPRDHMGTGIDLNSKNSLRGCIKNLVLNGVLVGEPVAQIDVKPCSGGLHKPTARRYDITDRGVASYFRGWVDVQGQGSSNDYCRVVDGHTGHYLSCALGGTTGDSEHNFNSPDAFDKGY